VASKSSGFLSAGTPAAILYIDKVGGCFKKVTD